MKFNKTLSNIQFITRTGMLLALTVVFQMVGRAIPAPANSFITGTLVNACLLVATLFGGLWSGIIISILAPFTSLINNHAAIASALLPFAPVVALGNVALVVAFYMFRNKSKIGGIAIGTAVKFLILYGGILGFFKLLEVTGVTQLAKFKPVMIVLFSYPQIITALLGGVIALIVIQLLRKQLKLK